MKKLVSFLLLAAAIVPLASCDGGETIEELFGDKDFDGIYNGVDSAPEDNKSRFIINDSTYGVASNEIVIPVDYRNFVFEGNPSYNKDLAQMCAVISNYSYLSARPNWTIGEVNKYANEESEINPALVQFGFNDVKRVVPKTSEVDPYDVVSLYLGNHVFEFNDNDYQVVVVSVEGYPERTCWHSNFDIGADTQAYLDCSGSEHPEWTNKKHHKGFDITANRAFTQINEYLNSVNDSSYKDQIVLVTGHSRGGAVSNLIGKKLKDNNIKSVVYAFNGPRTTTESDEAVLKSYTNIFNIDSVNDFVCKFPFNFMGFTSYGTILNYDLVENNDYYKSIFNHDFSGNSLENLAILDNLAEKVFISRETLYEYREKDPEVSEYELCESLEAANELKKQMDEEIKNANLLNCAYAQVVENEDPISSLLSPYMVEYYTRPFAILKFAGTAIVVASTSQDKVTDLLNLVDNGIRYISRSVGIALDAGEGIELDFLAFACPHMQKTCIAGAYVAK